MTGGLESRWKTGKGKSALLNILLPFNGEIKMCVCVVANRPPACTVSSWMILILQLSDAKTTKASFTLGDYSR